MPEKKLMPVIRVGRFRDMDGAPRVYTLEDLERLADSYDPSQHRAPLFLDAGFHTSLNGDAAGWVDALVVEGETLFALLGDVPPEVKEAVAEGRRRRVSPEIINNADGVPQSLFRVAILGASVPAVPGLPELDPAMFADGEKPVRLTFNFEEEEMSFFGKNKQDPDGQASNGKTPDKQPEKAAEAPSTETPAARPEGGGDKASLTQGDDDRTAKLSAEVAQGRKRIAELEAKMKDREIQAFTDGLTKEGKLPPGLNNKALHAFMGSLSDGDGAVVKFTDGEGKEQAAGQLALFQDFLSALPVVVKGADMFTRDLAGEGGPNQDDQTGDAIAASVNQD